MSHHSYASAAYTRAHPQHYASDLEHQLSEGAHAIGRTMKEEELDLLSAEQLGQLSVLREEAQKPHDDSKGEETTTTR